MNVFYVSPSGFGCVVDVIINANGVMKLYLVPFTLRGCSLNTCSVGHSNRFDTSEKYQLEIELIASTTYDTTIKISLRPFEVEYKVLLETKFNPITEQKCKNNAPIQQLQPITCSSVFISNIANSY